MAGGPPSSIDIGDGGYYGDYGDAYGGSGSSSSLTYYERKFGGYGSGGDFDPSSFIPSYTPTDKGEISRTAFGAAGRIAGVGLGGGAAEILLSAVGGTYATVYSVLH